MPRASITRTGGKRPNRDREQRQKQRWQLQLVMGSMMVVLVPEEGCWGCPVVRGLEVEVGPGV